MKKFLDSIDNVIKFILGEQPKSKSLLDLKRESVKKHKIKYKRKMKLK